MAILGASADSVTSQAKFKEKQKLTFPLLSDMNKDVLTAYGILKPYDVKGGKYQWARRTTFVVDKEGKIQHVEYDESAVNPNNAVAICTGLHEKHEK